MKTIIKRSIFVILALSILFTLSSFLPLHKKPMIYASTSNPFENDFDYDVKDISQLNTVVEEFVSIDTLYNIVSAVSVNENYHGLIDLLNNEVNNAEILTFIRLSNPSYLPKNGDWITAKDGSNNEYKWEYNGSVFVSSGLFTLDNTIKTNLETAVGSKKVAIRTADDLYKLGNMASINFDKQGSINSYIFSETIKKVLSFKYVLLDDIDYTTKKAQRFVPLGININIEMGGSTITHDYPFTGEFDGSGFTIKGLYLADYSYISTTFQDADASTAITAALFNHYSMFSSVGSSGVVKNFVLENPSYDLIVGDELAGLYKTSMLVGINKGLIYNVGVIDKKTQLGLNNSGIYFRIPLVSVDKYTGAGFVYENEGTIKNSFLSTERILNVNSSYNRFDRIEPFVYSNTGTLEGVSYLSGVTDLKASVDTTTSYNENEYYHGLTSGQPINLNTGTLPGNERFNTWYFYSSDGYPSLLGLTYNNSYYEINDDLDFFIFSKLLNKNSIVNGKTFDEHTYKLTTDINMKNYTSFKAIAKEFNGVLTSDVTTKYLYNLSLNNPLISGSNYYLSIFSSLKGTVENINFINNDLLVTNSDSHYGKTFYVGMIAGKLNGGTIKDVYLNGELNLGVGALGTTYAGGFVGTGNGSLINVANLNQNSSGIVNGNTHDFNNRNIIPKFYVGGLIGSATNIVIKNSFNEVEVIGVSSTNDNYSSTVVVETFTGGIVGELNNTTANGSSITNVTNYARITSGDVVGKNSYNSHNYIGGIFGSLKGYGFKLNDNNTVRNGRFENKGTIKGGFTNTYTKVFAGGIGVMNTTESYAKVSYVINKGDFDFTNYNYQTANNQIYYASTVVDNSSGGIELSRAYNTANYVLNNTFFNNVSGASNPSEIKIALFFNSVNDISSKLLYVENLGDLTVGSASNDSNISLKLKISNITQATKIDYKNVYNSGDVTVLRINNNNSSQTNGTGNSIFVAGITWILAYDNRPYLMENVVNDGKIITAGIKSNTTINGTVTGPSFSDTTFSANLNVKNLYVAGIVNLNVGEITNSFNTGTITSAYNNTVRDINGTANTFVGGINTFNYNLIKDVANSGLIEYTNSSTSSVSHFAATKNKTGTNSSTFGGISIAYTGGVVVAGIVAGLGDISGTELSGYKTGANDVVAEVIDTVNNGHIYGKAREYVRSGGILGIALSVELASGTYENRSTDPITAGPFTTAVIGSEDPVSKSLLSNGLNFGNIYAVTYTIGSYGNNNEVVDGGTSTTEPAANALRPGINAAAGGVIAYGLTKMIRMLNHGVISSTDVAGGVIGATYILGAPNQDSTIITEVDINTAVHYGEVKAIKVGSYNNRVFSSNLNTYNNFTYQENENFNGSKFYQLNEYNDFIYYRGNASQTVLIDQHQQARRGFGGIFGRLQRGNYGTMRATSFKNIMNMDPNIDMVGRVDSNVAGSLVYYKFFSGEDTYYSMKKNDTSPMAFVGWINSLTITMPTIAINSTITITRSGRSNNYTYTVTAGNFINVSGNVSYAMTRTVKRINDTSTSRQSTTETRTYNVSGETIQLEFSADLAAFGLTNNDVRNLSYSSNVATYTFSSARNTPTSITASGGTTTTPSSTRIGYVVPSVTDTPSTTFAEYIFANDFALRADSEYIYPVEEDALASRFRVGGENAKPNGMYVLSSSTGSIDGAALPTNINVTNLFRLNEDEDNLLYINLNDVKIDDKVVPLENDQEGIVYKYKQMYQLNYNNKAEILAEDENAATKIGELTLYDPNGNSPTLTGGIINRNNNTITFNVSNSAFSSNNFYYEVLSNELSKGAIIAKNTLSNQEYNTLRNDYNNRVNDVLPSNSDVKWSYSGSVISGSNTSFTIRVYSEIYVKDQNIRNYSKYFEDYTIVIIRSSTTLSMNATVTLNNTNSTHNQIGSSLSITDRQMPPTGDLQVLFEGYGDNDNNRNAMNALISVGHEMVVSDLYIGSVNNNNKIDSNFYDVEIIPKGTVSGNANQFGFIITLSDELQAGTYVVGYKYYNTSTLRTITFTKSASNNREIIDLDYAYFSSDSLGEDLNFNPTDSTNFTTYTEFGYLFAGVNSVNVSYLLTIITNYKGNASEFSYDYDVDYYTLTLNNEIIIDNLKIAPFATLNSASIKYEYTIDGLKKYVVNYNISPEVVSSQDITHNILERNITNIDIYLDNNLQPDNNFSVTREANLSRIDLDFNLLDSNLYNLMYLKVNNVDHINNDEIYVIESVNEFSFGITYLQDPGSKNYDVIINREGSLYTASSLSITKEKGISAYLIDIKYEGLDGGSIFKYPTISPADNLGNPISGYDTRFYSEGIDYLDLEGSFYHFKVNSEVSDIDLEDYTPSFILPYGAKIQRLKSDDTWTDLTADGQDDSLRVDYIGDDDNIEVIVYRVVPEVNEPGDYSNSVIYYVSAIDIEFNLTIRFKIYYNHPTYGLIEANNVNSPIRNSVVLISLKNLKLADLVSISGDTVGDFPLKTELDFEGELVNQSTLYYFVARDNLVNFRFGRNKTGAYNFVVTTPKYSGVETNGLKPNERYKYEMYMVSRGFEIEDWYKTDFKLPAMDSYITGNSGLFYYVYFPSTNPITRELAIVINPETVDKKWGIYDDYSSFD